LTEVVLGIFITQRANRIQSEANERISIAEKATAEAQERTANLQIEIANAQEHVAELQERTAKAEKDAAEANLARVRLERKFKPRDLDLGASRDLEKALIPYAGTRIDIFAFDSHLQEVSAFAYVLISVCRRAGCDCKLWMPSTTMPRMMGASVVLATALESTPEENELFSPIAMALAQSLARSDIKVNAAIHGFSKKYSNEPQPAPGFRPWNEDDVASFRIQIVEKALLDGPFAP